MRKILKSIRGANDYTQEQMAERLGVSRTTYCLIENGKSEGKTAFWFGVIREFPEKEAEIVEKLKERV